MKIRIQFKPVPENLYQKALYLCGFAHDCVPNLTSLAWRQVFTIPPKSIYLCAYRQNR